MSQFNLARASYEQALAIYTPLAATNPGFQSDLQRTRNNLDNLIRRVGLQQGGLTKVAPDDQTYLPKNDPDTPLRGAVVRLWPTFGGKRPGIGDLGTGFVVKRQGDRAWIVTARHVICEANDSRMATKVEAEIYSGILPSGKVSSMLEVVVPPNQPQAQDDEDLIVLELRGLPADVQVLALTTAEPQGTLKVVGHPDQHPWTVALFSILKSAAKVIYLDGGLNAGASGSPVLNGDRQVVGLVYRAAKGNDLELQYVMAYRAAVIEAKLKK